MKNRVLSDPHGLGAAPHGHQVAPRLGPVGGVGVSLGAVLAQLGIREGCHDPEQRRVGRDIV